LFTWTDYKTIFFPIVSPSLPNVVRHVLSGV
jgi:hypothetical protein